MTYEGLRLRLQRINRHTFASKRKKELKNTDFTIISNNCWGGMIYESYDLPKESPTVGLFFMADDYIKFCASLEKYLSTKLTFINPTQSKYNEVLKHDKRFGTYPIGLLDDIELMFLHYHSEKEALDKWNRRVKRVNFDKMIIKFNDQNLCSYDDVKAFSELKFKNKIFFTIKNWDIQKWDGFFKIKQHTKDNCITASHEPQGRNKYLNITDLINSL